MLLTYSRQLLYLDLVLKNNRVPHAFLFYGLAGGVQKKTAQAMVFRLNQPGAAWADFETGASELARLIKSDTHPDVLVVKKEADKKAIGIGQIRGLKSFVSRSPLNLATKAVIIEAAQSLTEESWNALLKTLEEPSGQTVIFVLSAGLKNIPKTIISRAVAVPFHAPAPGSNFQSKNDIIMGKLAGLEKLAIVDRFDLAELAAKREDSLEILDEWLLVLRSGLLAGKLARPELVEEVMKAKRVLTATNANPRLVWESLFLKF